MGCDIHLYTEALQTVNGKAKWVNVDNWRFNPWYTNGSDGESKMAVQSVYGNRNYDLFTLLAGVRDYSGESKCIDEPRGIPSDVSPQTKAEINKWDSDGHSHSWLTLAEIKAFHESNPTKKYTGLITKEQSEDLDKGIFPTSWCQGSSNKELVRREWEMPADDLKYLIKPLVERLKDVFWIYSDEYDMELENKIRVVFFFDN
jgi:hypothetical protein